MIFKKMFNPFKKFEIFKLYQSYFGYMFDKILNSQHKGFKYCTTRIFDQQLKFKYLKNI